MTEYVLDGRYELIERIATGGMGEVWRGVDQILGRPVAIKMLAATHAEDEQFRARFRAEARYAASLSHPGIARVFDYGEDSPLGGPYLVMELVHGEPLSAILERMGRLHPDVVLDIVAQAANALDAAHQQGIVHRDIKPGNLLIMADGTTKITDFGIAKANSVQAVNLTATGIVMGTALYVSPEQATGARLTGASDIYSLGVVAYECLSGQPPFVADQPLAIAIMHKHDPVPALPQDVPRPVSDLVLAMLAKAPEARPETARHVADRAEVILQARRNSGQDGPATAALPVVPDFPTEAGNEYYDYVERMRDLRRLTPRNLIIAGIGLAACGVVALVAVLLTSNGSPAATRLGLNSSPAVPRSAVGSATASVPPTTISTGVSGSNLVPGTQTAATSGTAQPTATQRQSPTPTQDPPATSASPSAPASSTPPSPSGSATVTSSASPTGSTTSPSAGASSATSSATR